MAKEVLQISEKKVVVDYDFRNDSDEVVTTEVAFPVPPYSEDWMEEDLASQSFADFQLWIDGKPTKFQAEAKAFLHGHDVTRILARDGVDVASFGHSKDRPGPYERVEMSDVDRLPRAEQTKLQTLGLINLDPDMPTANWTVHLHTTGRRSSPPIRSHTFVTSTRLLSAFSKFSLRPSKVCLHGRNG